MAVEILFPKISASTEEGVFAACHAGDGDRVSEGQSLFLLEAAGATASVEAPATGTLKINASLGKSYQVGTVLGTIE